MKLFISFYIVLIMVPEFGMAQDCIDYGDYLRVIGWTDTPDFAEGVAVSGDHAFVADGESGLQVIDISDPESPQVAGSVDTPGYARSVVISGNTAYVADGESGLQVIDITNPENPQTIGSVDTPGSAYAVAVLDGYAYVADYGSGLQVIDIANPASPQITGSTDTPGSAYDVAISGEYAYLTTGDFGLQVISIVNPGSPQIVGAVETSAYAVSIALSGSHAFVLENGGCPNGWFCSSVLEVIDIASPETPQIIGLSSYFGRPGNITISGTFAYVAVEIFHPRSREGWLYVLDITDPENPLQTDSTSAGSSDARCVAVSNNKAFFAAGSSGLSVVDVSNPEILSEIGNVETSGDTRRLAVTGTHAFVAEWNGGLQVVDITNPEDPQVTGSLETPGFARGVAVLGSLVYVADHSGLQIVDIAEPTSLQIIGSEETPGTGFGVAVSGEYACLADGGSGLQVIDISDSAAPLIIGGVDTPGFAYAVAISGGYVYVADWGSGLQVIDITNPGDPRITGSVDTPGYAVDVSISEGYAYVTEEEGGFHVIDITNPENPQIISSMDLAGEHNCVAIAGESAYVTGYQYGLQLIDITNSASPVFIGKKLFDEAYGVVVSEDYAYVIGGNELQVLPLQCDAPVPAPVYLTQFNLTLGPNSVTVNWQVASQSGPASYRLTADNGAVQWDVPLAPDTSGSFTVEDHSTNLRSGGQVTYSLLLNSGDSQWVLVDQASVMVEAPVLVARLFAPYPNPLNPQTTLSFYCATPGQVEVTVYDLAGHRVTVLVDGWLEAGRHEENWNGRDTSGKAVAAGQYFVRLQTAQGVDVQKVMMVK